MARGKIFEKGNIVEVLTRAIAKAYKNGYRWKINFSQRTSKSGDSRSVSFAIGVFILQ